MSVTRVHEDVLVIDCAPDSDAAGVRVVAEHQLVMSGDRTGRELVLAVAETGGPERLFAVLDVRDATALRDWITARLESGAIR